MASAASCPAEWQANRDIRSEEDQLRKSEADIASGWTRLHKQEGLVLQLKASGRGYAEAVRLAALLRDNLAEWERHRAMIEQRIAYLKRRRAAGST
ncbi:MULTISPECIES: hypothetical protein [unclassified Bradyrhizobium]|uniref:hypothetical protein n=1 Tax=unclassified Bradyrhizobium TaxID=2631580 RepID=UPI0028ED5CE7|nr:MULTISPECIES: hypothetical protein [unclassified Bradyrhizobium]